MNLERRNTSNQQRIWVMKARTSRKQGWLLAGAVLLQVISSVGAEPADANANVSAQTPVKVPYGVDDVLKLSKAQVSENIILTYIQTSGTTYNLGPNDIVYLKQQGVSDGVVAAMMDTQRKAAQATQAQAAQAAQMAPNPPVYQAAPNAAPATPQYAPVSTATYEQPAATDTSVYSQPVSSTYVIPYPQATYAYYGGYSYPYYPSYYWYPSVGFSFGYYGGYCGGYHGCYYGGHGYCYNNYHNGFYNGIHSGGSFHNGVHTSGSFSHGGSFSHAASFHGGGGGMRGGGGGHR
jgi:uncharacterized membrane protein YgcG